MTVYLKRGMSALQRDQCLSKYDRVIPVFMKMNLLQKATSGFLLQKKWMKLSDSLGPLKLRFKKNYVLQIFLYPTLTVLSAEPEISRVPDPGPSVDPDLVQEPWFWVLCACIARTGPLCPLRVFRQTPDCRFQT